VLAACLGSVGIVKTDPNDPAHDDEEPKHNLTHGSYLLAFLRGRTAAKQKKGSESREAIAEDPANAEKGIEETAVASRSGPGA
jgi:hypothetical protein